MFRLVAEFMANEGLLLLTDDGALSYFLGINFLHFALFLFLFCSAVLMIVSKLGTPQSTVSLEAVTFQKDKRVSFKWTTDVILTVVLIVLVLILWLIFSPLGIGG
jgi:SSS family solute:Na+ symporter